jgi:5-methylthioadenosine/S-adenosylhomocysteine deaminase
MAVVVGMRTERVRRGRQQAGGMVQLQPFVGHGMHPWAREGGSAGVFAERTVWITSPLPEPPSVLPMHAPPFRLAADMIGLLSALVLLACAAPPAPNGEAVDVLITGGTVITMDSTRRVLEDGAVAIRGDRIVAVGSSPDLLAAYHARDTIDATRKIIMPGLIDGHGHAGHGLVKSLGMDVGQFYPVTEAIYARGSTVDFWRAEALLTGVERVRFGVTTALSLFGGGDMIMRTDDQRYGDAYLQATQDVGLRYILAVGPRRPPFPKTYATWDGDSSVDREVTFEEQLAVSEALINKWHGAGDGRINLALSFATHHQDETPVSGAALESLRAQTQATRELSRSRGLLFVQDGHTTGTVKFAHEELGILGPDAILSHATEFTDEEIRILVETGTKIVHNPSANAASRKRFQLVELLDAGVTVMLGSDGVAPDRSYDMFRHMFQAMRYHRFAWRDTNVLPAGKVLEMVTIDAAKALGMEGEIGSLEAGKKADVILVDWFRPHMVPMHMPLYRVAYFANGNDVSTVLVNGQVVMRDRVVLTVNEEEVLTLAQREADAAIRRMGLDSLMATPEGFWGRSRLPD